MASRHDIINITFQANAGKANVALQTLQAEAKRSSDQVKTLKKQLEDGLKANLPADQIQKIRDDIKKAERDTKQWNKAYQELTKGVRTLDEAIKQFNAGTLGKMSAAFNKAAANAAKLAQTKMTPGTQEWKEMDALIVETQSNVLKANTALNELTNNIKKGGTASKSTLSQAKMDLEQLLTLEVRGSSEWNNYNKQLKLVTAELNRLAAAEKKAAQADQAAAMTKRMKGLKTMSSDMLAETKRFWEAMVAGAEKGSTELAKYEAKLKQITNEEKRRKKENAETVLKTPENYGAEQIRQAVQQMTLLRDALKAGTPMWQHYNNLVLQGEAALKKYDEVEKIARGDALSLADALKVSAKAGGKGFSGTANQLKMAEEALQKAAFAAKKGSAEWKKYQEALDKVRVEMQNTGITSERMRQILDKPANAKNLNELQAAVKRAKAELDLMAGTVGKNSEEYAKLAKSTKAAEQQLKVLQGQSKGTATAFDKAWSRLKTYIGLYMGAAVAIQKLTAVFGDIMELSDKMGEVRKTTGFTADEVGKLSDNLRKLDVRTGITGLMEVSAAAGQLGLKTLQDVEGFTIAANKLMIALPEMGKEAATEMMRVAIATGEVEKIRKQIQEGVIEGSSATAVAMEKIASTIDRLRATSASTAPEITDFVKRVGAVGAQSGITIDQVAALGSTVSSLGMRVEMSATALSRMIPAIKRNSFAIAKAIGTTQTWIDEQYKAGQGMEVILKIFEHIKQANMDSESIEQMFGASMQDVMKELNQQGARAGIVFAGLSQGVEELKRQLGVASKAYEENIAIQNEFNKMNETTAARWERLKNQLEEAFVSDTNQRALGWVVDGLRTIIDLLVGDSGLSVALKTILSYWIAIKIGIGQAFAVTLPKTFATLTTAAGSFFTTAVTGLKALTWQLGVHNVALGRARVEWKKMDLALKSNYIGAVVAALGYLIYKLWDFHQAAKEAAAEIGRFNRQISDEKKALDELFTPLNNSNTAQAERLKLINDINSKYGKYLGYMLSETSSAIQLADAHALIAKRIREEAYEKRLLEQENKIKGKYDENLNARYGWIVNAAREGAVGNADATAIADAIKSYIDKNLSNVEDDFYFGILSRSNESVKNMENNLGNILERMTYDGKISHDGAENIKRVAMQYLDVAKAMQVDVDKNTANLRSDLRGIQGAIKTDLTSNLANLVSNVISSSWGLVRQQQGPASQYLQRPQEGGSSPNMSAFSPTLANPQNGIGWNMPWEKPREKTAQLPKAGKGWKPKVDKNDIASVRQFVQDQDALRSAINNNMFSNEREREAAESWLLSDKEMEEYRKVLEKNAASTTGGGGSPYGGYKAMDPYEQWDADSLVARKKQMLEYVKALANGADVQAVLAKDEKFIDEATRKNIHDVRGAIEWYNRERLKIQDELAGRHLTNEGGWANPSKAKGRKKRQVYSEEAVAELDRYYAWRKEEIEEARATEEMTEAEYNRRLDALEQEHLQKRSDLRRSFTSDDKQFIESVWTWWKSVKELDQDIAEDGRVLINAEWKAATAKEIAYNNRDAQKDLTAMQAIVVKQLKEIEAIIDKERPFNGITANLQDNLTKMGILFKDGVDDKDFMKENTRRLTFLLKEAEDAYSLTFEQLAEDMRSEGLGSWADAIVSSKDADREKRAIIAQLHTVYDAVQDAIRKEASQVRKQVDIAWNDAILPNGKSIKQTYEEAVSSLGVMQGRVGRANSLIDAGQASDRVVDRLVLRQMRVQLAMQEHYYDLVRKTGQQRIADLKREADEKRAIGKLDEAERLELDAKHATMSLNLSLAKEQTELDRQREEIIARTEESQARLYKELRELGDLLASSMKDLFEASNAGNAEYYNELAKLNLTGKGGPGAGTYIVIEDAGTEDAKARYEYLDERQALERQHEIEQQNAQTDAWKKVMDDLNQKMSDQITDWMNATMQTQAIDANTSALNMSTIEEKMNTGAIQGLTSQLAQGIKVNTGDGSTPADNGFASDKQAYLNSLSMEGKKEETANLFESTGDFSTDKQMFHASLSGIDPMTVAESRIAADDLATEKILSNQSRVKQGEIQADKQMTSSSKNMFGSMVAACNMYGVAYQAMTNENLSTTQKFQMVALQTVGSMAMAGLDVLKSQMIADAASQTPGVLGKLWNQLGYWAAPVFAMFTGLLGGLMGVATSKITKSKQTIAQATGASASAGRLSTGMLTYAEGNVNEFTDPGTLTPGRQYNVDAADGRTYRARYMGSSPRTHLTRGPEFHLAGEKGREMIIDAGTTRQITMNDGEIWHAIQTLSAGGRMRRMASRRRGVKAFADGNVDEFTDYTEITEGMDGAGLGFGPEQMAAFQSSLERNNELLERALNDGFHAYFDVYGKGGLVDSYDTGKKNLTRHGEKY